MKNKTISYYVLEFLLAISILCCFSLLLIQNTILQEKFMQQNMKKSDFYHQVYNNIQEEFSYYILQSGLTDKVLENLTTEEELNEILKNYVHSFWEGDKLEIDTSEIQNRLEKNIVTYLSQNNIVVSDQNSLDAFVKEIGKTYQKNIVDAFPLKSFQKIFLKVRHLVPYFLIGSVITTLLIAVLLKLFFHRDFLTIPLLTIGMIYTGGYIYLKNTLDVSNFYLYTAAFSNLVKSIYQYIEIEIRTTAFMSLGIGITINILYNLFKKNTKNNYHLYENKIK